MPHINKLIDFCVDVVLVYENKVLLRKHDKYNIWAYPGGHIELHEDPNEAAVREVQEEVGINVALYDTSNMKNRSEMEGKELIAPYFLNRHRIDDQHEHISHIFFAKSPTDKIQPHEAEKSPEIRWFSKEELLQAKDIQKRVKLYALKALEILG